MSLQCRELEKAEFSLWDNFVRMHPMGTIFHQTAWLGMLAGGEVRVIAVWKDEQIIGGVSLLLSKKYGVPGYHIPPFTQYFSPLYYNAANSPQSITEEHACLESILNKIGSANHIDFKLPSGHHSFLPYHWKGFETTVVLTHLIKGTKESYQLGLDKKRQGELKRLKKGIDAGEISIEEKISEGELAMLVKETCERKNFNFNENVLLQLVNNAESIPAKIISIRSKQHGLVAFGFFPYDEKAMYNLVNLSVRGIKGMLGTVNLLLLNEAIEFALDKNLSFDFEGSMLPGVEAFFRKMGGKQVPIYRVQKSPSIKYSLLRAYKQIRNDRK